jgi:molybdate transport system substrate-binding protein
MSHLRPLFAVSLLLLYLSSSAHALDKINVFAAASLKDAMDEVAHNFTASSKIEVKASYAGSLALARQIEQGAPVDVFASADQDSMDYVATRHLIRPETRVDLLGNQLVVVGGLATPPLPVPMTAAGWTAALGNGRVAVGEVKTVPAGKYAKQALDKLGLWDTLGPHLAPSDNVRGALNFVVRGEAPLGIVYASDAKAEPQVKVVATFPEDSHAPIVYPFAITTASQGDAAGQFMTYLKSDAAKTVFTKWGFTAR